MPKATSSPSSSSGASAWRFLSACAVAAAAGACATIPPCPARGGPPWREIVTEHFVVHTDADSSDAREFAIELETLHGALLRAAWPNPRRVPTGRVAVVALDNQAHWHEYFPSQVDGMFSTVLGQPTIFVSAGADVNENTTIKHELIHTLSSFYLPVQPPWLSEGLAEYFETARYDRDDRSVRIGEPSVGHAASLKWLGGISTRELFTRARPFSQDETETTHFYVGSWLLVHYLLNRHPAAFAAYQRELQGGAEPAALFAHHFGRKSFADWDQELSNYARSGQFFIITQSFQPPEVRTAERVLDDAEVHVARAMLHAASAVVATESTAVEAQALARSELREALRQDPQSVRALSMLAERGVAPTVAQARALVEQFPDDWLAWRLLSIAEAKAGDRHRAVVAGARSLARAASNPSLRIDVIRLPLTSTEPPNCSSPVRVVAKVLIDAQGRVHALEVLESGGPAADATVREAATELVLEGGPASDSRRLWRLVPFDVCDVYGDAFTTVVNGARKPFLIAVEADFSAGNYNDISEPSDVTTALAFPGFPGRAFRVD